MDSIKLKRISLFNFRNYAEAGVQFPGNMNVFAGHNGAGKTNLLDAIHYLSFCKSYFQPADIYNIRHGEEYFMVQGVFENKGIEETVSCSVRKDQRKIFKRNGKEYERLAGHIGLYPAVIIAPSDMEIIGGGSGVRRRFMDSIISQHDGEYLNDLIRYSRGLIQRNALLKRFAGKGSPNRQELSLWDTHLVVPGSRICRKRMEFIHEFIPVFSEQYRYIGNHSEAADIEYSSQLVACGPEDIFCDTTEELFMRLLDENVDKDRLLQFTTAGIHKDDLKFRLGGESLNRFGSQGEQKSLVIALKLAQVEWLKRKKDILPLLLMDDIFDKLDPLRLKKLMQLVSQNRFGQLFITHTGGESLMRIFSETGSEVRLFNVSQGRISAE